MSNSITISGVILCNTVSVQQLAPMLAVRVPVLHASRAFNRGRIQNDEAFIGQIRGVENVGAAFLVCLVVVIVIAITTLLAPGAASGIVLAPVIPGIAPANNFDGSFSAPAPA
ncbi:hypothetical protein B7463_g11528, partial [Scytalidium lignicola]